MWPKKYLNHLPRENQLILFLLLFLLILLVPEHPFPNSLHMERKSTYSSPGPTPVYNLPLRRVLSSPLAASMQARSLLPSVLPKNVVIYLV
jgi:hypothetical protein